MGRPKKFDERIQVTLVEGTTERVDALLASGEYRLDFIRTAIEREIEARTKVPSPADNFEARTGGRKKPNLLAVMMTRGDGERD